MSSHQHLTVFIHQQERVYKLKAKLRKKIATLGKAIRDSAPEDVIAFLQRKVARARATVEEETSILEQYKKASEEAQAAEAASVAKRLEEMEQEDALKALLKRQEEASLALAVQLMEKDEADKLQHEADEEFARKVEKQLNGGGGTY
jgi:hypothetical protein